MKRFISPCILFTIFFLVMNSFQLKAQVFINEFLASNTGANVDPDFQESADWIELYNNGNSSVNLGGYYLSDNFNDHIKWKIPQGTQISAKGFLVIWADGYNTGLHTNFKISADGEQLVLYKPGDILADSLSFGLQEPNISMGRKTDGGADWGYFLQPTPGAENSNETFSGVVKNVPIFSPLGGIFTGPVTVNITNTFGGDIRYTLDGSEPTQNSLIVNGPITINYTTIIRASIYQAGKIPGKIITNSYFINSDGQFGSLPIVSIATNPENFWDPVKGIYVQDFKPEWEVPINIELFENDGSDRAGFNESAGTKVNGLYSWQLPQKMLGIYFRKEYGNGNLDYPLFFDRTRSSFDNFALRASGSDWAYSLFRDGMIQSLTAENMDVDFQGFRAAVLYINGQYMGIHNIRSKIDEDFIVQNHGLQGQLVDMIENENYVETGSLYQYTTFEADYHKDLTNQANFDAVANVMDIENFTDFMVTEIYSQNTSVDHNIMAWKPQTGGKWKWILNDLDRGFFKPGSNMISFYADRNVIPLKQLLTNEGYRKYFGKRLADHLFTTFDPERVKTIIDEFKSNIENEIPKHIQRWQGTSSGYGNPISSVNYWNNEVEKMKTFANGRPVALLNDLQNYGFAKSKPLSIVISPENAGKIQFNGIEIKQAVSNGNYPANEEITLVAQSKSVYFFKGWAQLSAKNIIGRQETWKYNDSGNELPANWKTENFNDADWKEGLAELGYGDNDENTVIGFGQDSRNKFITSYFRKSFSVENTSGIQNLKIALKCDDGAVVYLNGTEVVRQNLQSGQIDRLTPASSAVSGTGEQVFTTYIIDSGLLKTGNNVFGVEVHQSDPTSSDISFDLELTASAANANSYISTNPTLKYTHTGDAALVAEYESDGTCILPEEITTEMILDKSCSPYRVPANVLLTSTGNLIINPGVELWISDGVSITINGSVHVNGTKTEPVIFKSNPDAKNKKWGILNFVNADTSYLNNFVIENASKGVHPLREVAAISAFHSVLKIDGGVIENVHENPIAARYSDISLKNSSLHSEITGDLINIKFGKGFIDSCRLVGNNKPDTDGIDYDDVENGVIRNSEIRDFQGLNSDAIDIGEQAQNISIENIVVYNITDKGVSVGQQSSGAIKNSIFVNCNLGVALKDSSYVTIDRCTFYGNGTSVACFEKNAGDAGGNAVVTNTIFSNAYDASYSCDNKSTFKISYSASDNDVLPDRNNNLFTNPRFINPNLFDFELAVSSPCISTGTNGNMGATPLAESGENNIFISGIAYKTDVNPEVNEFVELSNSGNTDIDISGFEFTKGITFQFPEGTKIKAGGKVYVAYDSGLNYWLHRGQLVFSWESGRLADEGEIVRITTPQGIVIDQVQYNIDTTWPEISDGEGLTLKSDNLDNHFGENWEKADLSYLVRIDEITDKSDLRIYPNPTNGIIYFTGLQMEEMKVDIFNLTGVKVLSQYVSSNRSTINLSDLKQGIYIVRSSTFSQRLILLK